MSKSKSESEMPDVSSLMVNVYTEAEEPNEPFVLNLPFRKRGSPTTNDKKVTREEDSPPRKQSIPQTDSPPRKEPSFHQIVPSHYEPNENELKDHLSRKFQDVHNVPNTLGIATEILEQDPVKGDDLMNMLDVSTFLVDPHPRRDKDMYLKQKKHDTKVDTTKVIRVVYQSVLYDIHAGEHAGKVLKLYAYDNKFFTESIVSEIAFQISAFQLNGHCAFHSPGVVTLGFIPTSNITTEMRAKLESEKVFNFDYKYLFYFVMDKMNSPSLQKYLSISMPEEDVPSIRNIVDKVEQVNGCLESKNIYHNDLNIGNVLMVSPGAGDAATTVNLGLIDYGEATPILTTFGTKKDATNFKYLTGLDRRHSQGKGKGKGRKSRVSRRRPHTTTRGKTTRRRHHHQPHRRSRRSRRKTHSRKGI